MNDDKILQTKHDQIIYFFSFHPIIYETSANTLMQLQTLIQSQTTQSSLIMDLKVTASFRQIGEIAATNSPLASSPSLNAIPQDCPFLKNSIVPSNISIATPIMSPGCKIVPYFGPVELLLCLVQPLQIPQPCTVSEKASYKFRGVGLHTPILMSVPLLIKSQKQYLPPASKISEPIAVLNPLPSLEVQTSNSSSRVSLGLVLAGFQQKSAALQEKYEHQNPQAG